MPLYRIDDREVVSAASPSELIDHLRATSFSPVRDNQAFRERAALFAGEVFGKSIRTDDDDVFVEDMLARGIWSSEPSQ